MALKKKTVKADERDYRVGDRAGRRAFQVFAVASAALGLALLGLSQLGFPSAYPFGLALSFSACSLLLLYILFYHYYNQRALG